MRTSTEGAFRDAHRHRTVLPVGCLAVRLGRLSSQPFVPLAGGAQLPARHRRARPARVGAAAREDGPVPARERHPSRLLAWLLVPAARAAGGLRIRTAAGDGAIRSADLRVDHRPRFDRRRSRAGRARHPRPRARVVRVDGSLRGHRLSPRPPQPASRPRASDPPSLCRRRHPWGCRESPAWSPLCSAGGAAREGRRCTRRQPMGSVGMPSRGGRPASVPPADVATWR